MLLEIRKKNLDECEVVVGCGQVEAEAVVEPLEDGQELEPVGILSKAK